MNERFILINIQPRACNLSALQRRHRSEEHTSELQSRFDLVCRLLLENKKIHPRRAHLLLLRACPPPHIYALSLHAALPISAAMHAIFVRVSNDADATCGASTTFVRFSPG